MNTSASDLIVDWPKSSEGCVEQSSMRKVSFSNLASMRLYKTNHIDTKKSWYSHDDERRFKQGTRNEVVLFRALAHVQGNDSRRVDIDQLAHNQVCSFGLEHLISRELHMKRIQTKRAVMEAVLAEQHRQGTCFGNEDGAKMIALVSMHNSKWATIQAKELGSYHAFATSKERF